MADDQNNANQGDQANRTNAGAGNDQQRERDTSLEQQRNNQAGQQSDANRGGGPDGNQANQAGNADRNADQGQTGSDQGR